MTLNMFTELPIDMLFYIYFLIGSIIVLALGMVIAKKQMIVKAVFHSYYLQELASSSGY